MCDNWALLIHLTMEKDIDVAINAITFGLGKLQYQKIRTNQNKVVENYLNGKDVFFCSPTGSGKSLTFEIAPFVFQYKLNCENSIVVVISPLTSLMRSQASSLQQKGIKAVYLRDLTVSSNVEDCESNLTTEDVKLGKINIVIASPESLLGHHRELLIQLSKQKLIKALFIDEAHCIKKYGKPDKKKKKPAYRPCYGRLGEIRSLIGGNIPVIALTATATPDTKAVIYKDLCMENCTEVIVSPDKKNITYWVHNLEDDDICKNFQWLVNLLKEEKISTTRMIIFFRQIKHISEVYEHLESSLGRDAYVDYKENGPNDDRNRLFDMFHMKTDDDVKDSICASYQDPKGNIRVVLCSTSFSMGLDVKGVDTVIHYGPANDIDDYLQESGRAGRDLSCESHAILLLYKRCLGSKNISSQMKEYVKSKSCRRTFLLNVFNTTKEPKTPLHLCCDICRQCCKCYCKCKTSECNCSISCLARLPVIYNAIRTKSTYEDDADDDDDDDECGNDENEIFSPEEESALSSDSDVEHFFKKKPQVIYSSDDDV